MPLFARTEKRLKRKEREDELGITAVKDAMKENGELGGSDSEEEEDLSDESESEDEDEDEDEDEEDDEDQGEGEVNEDEEDASQDDEDDGDDDSGSEGDDEPFPLTIEDVESNPIYPMEEHEGCLLCPGKTLKNDKMRETHLASTSHKRAMKRWIKRIAQQDERPLPSNDPRDVMNEILDDLEDRKAGQPAQPVSTSDSKAGAKGPETKRRKGDSKKARQQARAEEALEAAKAGAQGEGKGLNRKARRLLAKQQEQGGLAALPAAGDKADTDRPKETQEKKGKKQRRT